MSPGPFDRGPGLRRRWLLGWEGRIGRLDWSLTPSSLNLPRLRVYRDGEGSTTVVIALYRVVPAGEGT